jgi:hypothetical protein
LCFTIIGDFSATLQEITWVDVMVNALNRIQVFVLGDAVVSVRPQELGFLMAALWEMTPAVSHQGGTNVVLRSSCSMVIPFGRRLYWGNECLPAFPAGQVELQYDLPALPAGMTARLVLVEGVFLPDASPLGFLRYRDVVRATQVVGFVNDVNLPVGFELVGVLLRENTQAISSTAGGTIEQYRLLGDDKDVYVQTADWNALWGESRWRDAVKGMDRLIHVENLAGVYTQNAQTNGEFVVPNQAQNLAARYAYLDLDWNKDGSHLLDTSQFNTLVLRFDANQTDEIRLVPVQLVRGIPGTPGS